MWLQTKEKPTISLTHHNKTMVISVITSMMEVLRKGILSKIPDLWQIPRATFTGTGGDFSTNGTVEQ